MPSFLRKLWNSPLCTPCQMTCGLCCSGNKGPRSTEESWLTRIGHWGPIIAILIITTVTLSATYSALQIWSLPVSVVPYMRGLHFCVMYMWLIPIFWNFLMAMKRGPGYVPHGWKPQSSEDQKCLQYCNECQGYKPPRTHHCKQCNRCIMKMDHHCPWINSCVGHSNHTNFLLFLFFVPFGCIHGVVVNSNFLYHLLSYHFTYHRVYLDLNFGWIMFAITGISFGAGTTLGVFILFLTQIKGILSNCTQIEDWIVSKAVHRREKDRSLTPFVFPYNLGWRSNLSQVVNWRCAPVGNGTEWPTRPGCHKYDFTVEQLEQKKAKKIRAITCEVKRSYDGSTCPLSDYGLRTAMCAPRCLEDTIPVHVGDLMSITRWERTWVYGNLLNAEVEVKGWFPRQSINLPEKYKRPREKPSSPKKPPPSPSQNAAPGAAVAAAQDNVDQLSYSGTPSSPTSESEERECSPKDAPKREIGSQTETKRSKKSKKHRQKDRAQLGEKLTSDEDVPVGNGEDASAVEGLTNGPFKLVKRHKRGKRTSSALT